MIVIKIPGWHPDRARASYSGYHPRDFVRRLYQYTDLQKSECEDIANQVRKQTCKEIPLAKAKDRYGATSIRNFLDSLGADTTVEET